MESFSIIDLPVLRQSGEMEVAIRELAEARDARKCWQCGCLHSSLRAIEEAYPDETRPQELASVISEIRPKLVAPRYDCLGCEVCWPANAINALGIEGDACPTEAPDEREGWPPLPGDYTVLRYNAPVAVCTLTDHALSTAIASERNSNVSITGTMQTENLGIERLITNIIANPNIHSLVLCGEDTKQTVGHLPGQSLLALKANGVGENGRIIGAKGKRPLLKNLSADAVQHFRENIDVIDMIGSNDLGAIFEVASRVAAKMFPTVKPFYSSKNVSPVRGHLPPRMIPDPNGYFVVYPDRKRGLLSVEHFLNTGVLNAIFEGASASELYTPVIERNLISRLEHAAYLGKELARAEEALYRNTPYIQDAAPEIQNHASVKECGCTNC